MKYFSELTKHVYDTIEELESAEKVEQEKLDAEAAKKAKRTEAAKAVEAAFDEANKAYKHANELLKEFTNTYGSFHMSVKDVDSSSSLFDAIFNSFLLDSRF